MSPTKKSKRRPLLKPKRAKAASKKAVAKSPSKKRRPLLKPKKAALKKAAPKKAAPKKPPAPKVVTLRRGDWGPVVALSGPYIGKFGLYDSDSDGGLALVYFGRFLVVTPVEMPYSNLRPCTPEERVQAMAMLVPDDD